MMRSKFFRYLKMYRLNSILFKNCLFILLLIAFPIFLIGLILYSNSISSLQKEILATNTEAISKSAATADLILNQSANLAVSIYSRHSVDALITATENIAESMYQNINNVLITFENTYSHIESIYIYSEKNNILYTSNSITSLDDFTDTNWFSYYQDHAEKNILTIYRKINNRYPYVLSLIYPIYSGSHEKLGSIIINVNVEVLGETIFTHTENNENTSMIVDKSDTIIYSTMTAHRHKNYASVIKDNYFSEITISSQNFPLQYVYAVSKFDYMDKFYNLFTYIILTSCGIIILSFLVAYLISVYTFKPIDSIIRMIESGESTNYYNNMSNSKKNEIAYVISSIQRSINAEKSLKEELNKRLLMLKDLQMSALQVQISPHFLFNTLDIVNWTTIKIAKGPNPASDMISLLSDMCKLMLNSNEYLTSIQTEIVYTNKYIEILKMRYKELIHFDWDVDENVLQFKTIKILLQPIIENAASHGIKPRKLPGKITISAMQTNGNIVFTISDNGVGIENDKLKKLIETINAPCEFGGKNIGLKSVNQRIKIFFGESYGVTISSKKDYGTTVTVTIPQIDDLQE